MATGPAPQHALSFPLRLLSPWPPGLDRSELVPRALTSREFLGLQSQGLGLGQPRPSPAPEGHVLAYSGLSAPDTALLI